MQEREELGQKWQQYLAGACDAYTTDVSGLAATRAGRCTAGALACFEIARARHR